MPVGTRTNIVACASRTLPSYWGVERLVICRPACPWVSFVPMKVAPVPGAIAAITAHTLESCYGLWPISSKLNSLADQPYFT